MLGQLGEYENYQREELTAYPRITKREMAYKDFTTRRDRGLVWQAMFLDLPECMHLVNAPPTHPSTPRTAACSA